MKKILFTLFLSCVAVTGASAQMLINGAGATFPQQIYTKWFDEYRKVDPSVSFNYQGIGSGGGQKQILAETVDFGASDGPMSDENLAKAPRAILAPPDGRRRGRPQLQPGRQPAAQARRPDAGRDLPRQDHEVERPARSRARTPA